jgi:mannose-6-phosphate isomerase-like protein (cupin superfamily)
LKINLDKTDSKVIKSNETYDVIDNTNLDKLIVSKTILHVGKETGGHNHSGQEEVYIFIKGEGKMVVGSNTYIVKPGDTILIPDGDFHKVLKLYLQVLLYMYYYLQPFYLHLL